MVRVAEAFACLSSTCATVFDPSQAATIPGDRALSEVSGSQSA